MDIFEFRFTKDELLTLRIALAEYEKQNEEIGNGYEVSRAGRLWSRLINEQREQENMAAMDAAFPEIPEDSIMLKNQAE